MAGCSTFHHVKQALILPILMHCRDHQGVRCSDHLAGPDSNSRDAHSDIPAVVEAMRTHFQ